MNDLVKFLLHRFGEDEAIAARALEWWDSDREAGYLEWPSKEASTHVARHDPTLVLREVEAKRRILDLHAPGEMEYIDEDICMTCDVRGEGPYYPCQTLRLLALAYADHPDYREEWAPRATPPAP